ncbi:FGGY family carbohydrate kinase [Sphingomonas echinoides]|uniref:Glycerol kinase n=1 Tax=Sphingomonas echinoides TaxID=59803 RepID=A0ABU4PLN4_9SPHN|nr:glycerol kinase GlpK [Sphingomonas echinoides]MDX5985021.1 glycerol kinase [Sphingomonas echinoides]
MSDLILVIDEGTTSTRAMVFQRDGGCVATAGAELTQHYPEPGRVEHDATEIWAKTLAVTRAVIDQVGGAEKIAAIGITNQRETIVFWDRETGQPLAPAIVWQDRRTATTCRALKEAGNEPMVQAKTGLLLDPYFSGSKIGWAMAHWDAVKTAGSRLAVGTVESWLIWKLTGGLHITDATNASRTALMAIGSGHWDDGLIELFGAPRSALPEIVDCAGRFGETRLFGAPIPICGIAGDQQAATIGQSCLQIGETKATFGTGAFVLSQAGPIPPTSRNRLLSTIAWQIDGRRAYALEGSVFVAGSLIKWLRDAVGLIGTAAETEALARSVPDNGGTFLVPALSGLGAPWWEPEARAAISGLSFSTGKAHIVRAALEAMAHQAHDLKTAFAADGVDWASVRIDGGMVANDWMAQDMADILGVNVERPKFAETTALGAAMLAGVGRGLFANLAEASAMRGHVETFTPHIAETTRTARLDGWRSAVQRVIAPD